MLKYLLSLPFLLCASLSMQAQFTGTATDGIGTVAQSPNAINFGTISTASGNKQQEFDGTKYIFDQWMNYAVVEGLNGEKFILKNINYNTQYQRFESKFSDNDSLFSFYINQVNDVIINGRKFKGFESPKDKRMKTFEVVYENDDFKILKDYVLKIREPKFDPLMIQSDNDKFIIREEYFLKSENSFEEIRLKKGKILDLLGAQEEAVADFAKEKKLSFKDEYELKQILTYYDSVLQP
ncbi:hypothetical protein [Croceiramulus getboli]|nr:hypothetical protein P8624_07580 [Flavobacteriaceae bacterium YJPT1-3]